MPEKTIYSVTENGKKALSQTLTDFLLNTELDHVKFNIACLMLHHLDKDYAMNVLKKRLSFLKKYENGIKKHYNYEKDEHLIPYPGLTIIRNNIYLTEAEIKITEELIIEVEKDDTRSGRANPNGKVVLSVICSICRILEELLPL